MTTLTVAEPGTATPVLAPRWRWLPGVLTAVVIAPIVVAVARAVRARWFPIGDSALLYLRARDVFTDAHPLLGSWTSASLSIGHDVNNPGPLYSDLVAPFGHLLNGGAGAAVGVGVANIVAVIGISLAARHVGGWRLQRVMLLASAALVWTMGSWLLIDIWQPHALLLPFVLLLVLLLGLALGRWRCMPWVVAVGSLIVQTHIAYAYVLALLGAATLLITVCRRGSPRAPDWRLALRSRIARVSAAVFVVLWSQPLVEQLFGSGQGNLSRLASGAAGGGLKVGVGDATRLAAAVLLEGPWRLRSGFTTAVPRTPLTTTADGPTLMIGGIHRASVAAVIVAVVVAALVALALAHRRGGDQLVSSACWLAAAGVLAAVACVGVVTVGPVGLGQHHVRWLWPMTIFVQVVGGWAGVELVARRLRDRDRVPVAAGRAVGALAASAVVVLAGLAVPDFAQPEGPTADRGAMPALRQAFDQLASLRSSSPVVFDLGNLVVYEPYSSAIMMRLQELGIEFRVTEASMVRQVGNHRRVTGDERTTIFQLQGLDAVLYDGTACRIASASALTGDDSAAARTDARVLADRLAAGRLSIDVEQLSADDRSAHAAATDGAAGPAGATHGDDAAGADGAAMQIVADGTLARWSADGSAQLSDDDRASLAHVGRWVSTAYALLATNPVVCPSSAPA